MEFLNWKNILLEWVNRLNYLGRPYYSLNMANIEPFFNEFKTRVISVNIASMTLPTFFKAHYKDFDPALDNEGNLCSDDYMYGYSLLMHFCCIKHPEVEMRCICQKMQEETQLVIKIFLENLMRAKPLTRETIKFVIESSAPAKMSDYVLALSPIKTGQLDVNCPPTPRTKMLNEWSSENRQLKAQVETERYEKTFLESKLKNKEERINELNQERRKFLTDIQELKSKLSEKDLGNIAPNENTQIEMLKRRLRKEISDKEEEIKDLQNQVNDLTAAKKHFAEKFSFVESEYKKSIVITKHLNGKLEEAQENSEKQLQHIKGLEITLREHQKYFNESGSKGSSLDVSMENLDDSYTVAMAMLNRSLSSPENLGKVVDIQLREQILKNEQLLDQFNQIQQENSELKCQIEERILQSDALELKCQEIENENSRNVKLYEDTTGELAVLSKESDANLKELQLLRSEFDALMAKANESQRQIENLNGEKSSLKEVLLVCEQEVIELRNRNAKMADENVNCLRDIERFTASESKLKSELETNSDLINRLQSLIRELENKIKESDMRESFLQSEVDRLTKLLDDLRSQINRLQQESETLSKQYRSSLNEKEVEVRTLEKDRNLRNVELEHQIKLVSELSTHIENVESKLIATESSKADLTTQIKDISSQKDAEVAKLQKERDVIDDQVANLKTCLSNAQTIESTLLEQNAELVRKMEKETNELSSEVRNLSANLVSVQNSLTTAESLQVELSNKNLALTQENADKESKIDKQTQECYGHLKERDSLNENVAQLENEIQNLKTEYKVVDTTLMELSSKHEKVKSELTLLHEKLSESRTLQADLEVQFNQSEEEKERLFLSLQEKTDDAEAVESTLNELIEKNRIETARREDLDKKYQANCDLYESKIAELEKTVCQLTIGNQHLNEVNNNLKKEVDGHRVSLHQLRAELQITLDTAEQNDNEKKHFLETVEQLTASKDINEKELNEIRLKLTKYLDTNDELETQRRYLEMENQNLKKCTADLEAKRDELMMKKEATECRLLHAEEELKLKTEEVAHVSKSLDDLKIESKSLSVAKLNLETDLQKNLHLVKQLSEKVEQNDVVLGEKLTLIDSLSDQIKQLKTVESSMTAESSKLSERTEELVQKLATVECSRETLSMKCKTLSDELKTFEDKYNDLEQKLIDRSLEEVSMKEAHKSVEKEIGKLKQQIIEMTEIANREQSDLKRSLEISQEQITAVASKAKENEGQRVAEIEQLKQVIEKLGVEKVGILSTNVELIEQVKTTTESYQQGVNYKTEIEELIKNKETLSVRVNNLSCETEKLKQDLETAKRENLYITDENIDLATENERIRQEYLARDESKNKDINSMKSEIDRLVATNAENLRRFDELQKTVNVKSTDGTSDELAKVGADLKVALADLQSKMQECEQYKQQLDQHRQYVNDNLILSAKLTRHREISSRLEEQWQKEKMELLERSDNLVRETRFEYEGKLNKMKERMKHIYTDEQYKAKEKYDKQERELLDTKKENLRLTDQIEKYDNHVRQISRQLYKANETSLDMKKENEFLKNKLRLVESNPRESRLFAAPNFGSNFKMEDEEGEVFNNTYLTDLKSGISRASPTGRESIRMSELQQRNSLAARHLRSTYVAQYGDQNLREEDISMPYFNDSMFSNQLDVRRGTLYKRPGPPTPSKNGGRLSFGGGNVTASELFPRDILREQNNNAKTKTTPGKLMSMFTSSTKHKETALQKPITRPIYSTFTSTPRQKSNWTSQRNLVLRIKQFPSQLTDSEDEIVSTSASSLLSPTSRKGKSVCRRFSIISKQRQGSAIKSMIYKNRLEYREKHHSKRLRGFEECREMFFNANDDDDFQLLEEQIDFLSQSEIFRSEQFEILAKHTPSEHPYSNEPTAIEANEISMLSSSNSLSKSKTMSNIIIYGKIPRITVNATPQRELIQLKHRSGLFWLKLMDFWKQIILISILIVLYGGYLISNLFIDS